LEVIPEGTDAGNEEGEMETITGEEVEEEHVVATP
jgi:hypothetical protein